MSSSDTGPATGRSSRRRQTVVLVASVLLGSSLLMRSTAVVEPTTAAGVLVILVGVGIVLSWRRSSKSGGEDSDGDVWDAIPSRQYEGRHAESGGLARGEQERALRDVQRQADDLSTDPDD